jgi:arabinogalactan oligomer/maltooligosaccharide transport system substrate-binding protein
MNKRFSLVMVLVTLFGLLAACGPTPEPTKVPPPTAVVQPTPVPPTAVPYPTGPVSILLWTKEGEADGGLQYVKGLTDAYSKMHPNVTFDVVNKDVETLREDFQNASLAGSPPQLLWTVSDHAGPFTTADLIEPVDDMFDLSMYVDSALAAVELNGKTWGVPIANGNHLMLIYNKALLPTPPKDTDELISMGQAVTQGDVWGLVYNQTEPFWLVPWLGGFGGKVFQDDGVTPNLNTPEMINTLQWLYDLKYTYKIVPPESDYNGADSLFKEGKAAMIINGDWALGGYKALTNTVGQNLGVARIPMVKSTGMWPAPYTSGVFFMIPKGLTDDQTFVVKDFILFATNKDNQVDMVKKLTRLPALKAALDDPTITSDPILKGSADQMVVGTPMPTNVEMRCNWDAAKPEMQAVLAGTKSPTDAAAAMQAAAEACVQSLK